MSAKIQKLDLPSGSEAGFRDKDGQASNADKLASAGAIASNHTRKLVLVSGIVK